MNKSTDKAIRKHNKPKTNKSKTKRTNHNKHKTDKQNKI